MLWCVTAIAYLLLKTLEWWEPTDSIERAPDLDAALDEAEE
jgi:hypothetical protein